MTWEIVSSILPNILTRDIFFDLDLPFILGIKTWQIGQLSNLAFSIPGNSYASFFTPLFMIWNKEVHIRQYWDT